MYIENNSIKNNLCFWLASMFLMIALMIIIGGLTRLTDSGLSITRWQLFSGILPPFNESDWQSYFALYKEIPEYRLQNSSMSLNEFKVIFWWEWIHRFIGRLIGISFLIPLIFFYVKLGFYKTKNLFLIFFLICLQGFIGWYMVSGGLVDRVDVSHFRLSLHLLLAFIILSLVVWNFLNYKQVKTVGIQIKYSLPTIFLVLIFIQILIGAFVAGMDAGKIYNSWPLMGTSYFPNDNSFINLFKLSAFNDPSLVQFMHRNLAYLIFLFYLFIVFVSYKNKLYIFFKSLILIGILLFFQIIFGILTLLFDAQIIISSAHQIILVFLVSSCIYLLYLNSNTNLQPSN